MKVLVPLLAVVALLTGCTTVAVKTAPKVDVSKYQHIFVLQPLNENHHVDEMLVDELKLLGRDATSGPMTMLPDNADAVLSYNARWTGDFGAYVIEFNLALRTPHTDKLLAEARYYQPSALTKPVNFIVHKLITDLFAPKPAGTSGK